MHEARTRPGGRLVFFRDAAANDSNKTIVTVPAGKMVEILWISTLFATTATVGNRIMAIRVTDGVNNIQEGYANHLQAASLTHMYYWAAGYNFIGSTVAGATGNSNQPLSRLLLPAGYQVIALDASAIDPAADDLTVNACYIEYDA